MSLQKWFETLGLCTFSLGKCFAQQRRAIFRTPSFQKWSEHVVMWAFWLWNVLRATAACNFSKSQLPKVVRTWCVLYILTSKCASRHSGVHFFRLSDTPRSPNAAPATKNDTPRSPNTAPATKSDTPRSPNAAPATKNDSHHWSSWHMNVIYNARSNSTHPPTSPNTAPATQNDSHEWCPSHMKRHLQCAEQQASPSNLTKYCACHAKLHSKIEAKLPENRWTVIYTARPIRAWSEHDPTMNSSSRTRPVAEVTLRASETHFVLKITTFCAPAIYPNFTKYCACHEKWHSNITKCCACHEKWHSKITKCCACHEKWHSKITKYCAWHEKWHSKITKCCACHCTLTLLLFDLNYGFTKLLLDWTVWAVTSLLLLDWAVTWLSSYFIAVTLLNCYLTELFLHWTVTLLNCYITELLLYWAVTLLSGYFTELLLYWTFTLLNCYFTELLLHWTVTLLSCYLTELLLYWAVTLLSCYFTELLLYWTVTSLSCYFTELLLCWPVTLLNCYFTDLLLYWAVTLLSFDFTELLVY